MGIFLLSFRARKTGRRGRAQVFVQVRSACDAGQDSDYSIHHQTRLVRTRHGASLQLPG